MLEMRWRDIILISLLACLLVSWGRAIPALADDPPWSPTVTPKPAASATPTETPTITPTATSTLTPTVTSTPTPAPPSITSVEPDWFLNTHETQITILGRDFQPGATVRVVFVGLLSSTFVNHSVLTAVFPAGMAKGDFNLVITNPDGQSDTLEDAFEVVEPTPTRTVTPERTPTAIRTSTPVPTATSTPYQRPLLFINSSSTNPPSTAPEESVVVTLKIKNIGDTSAHNIRVTFTGGVFVPRDTGGTQALPELRSGSETTVNQSLTLSGEGTTGIYQQEVKLEYEDPNGVPYNSTEVVGIPVTTPEVGLPQIIIRDVQILPNPILPGQPFSMTFTLHNVGDGTASDVLVSVGANGPAVPLAEGGSQVVDMLGIQGKKEVFQRLIVSESTSKGSYSQAISIEYRDEEDISHVTEQRVGLIVAELEEEEPTSQPRLTVANFRSEPGNLVPGELFNLFVDIVNVGEGPAKDIRLSLGSGRPVEGLSGGSAGSSPAPFAPLDTSNVKYIPYLGSDERASIAQRMVVDSNTRSGVYVLDITFSYHDNDGVNYTSGELVSLLVIRLPHLQIGLYRPVTKVITGERFEILVEVINIGQHTVSVSTMELRSLDVEIHDGTMYVGPLDPGTSSLLEAEAIALHDGEAVVQIIVRYLDDFGHQQQIIQELRLGVGSPPTAIPTLESGREPGEDISTPPTGSGGDMSGVERAVRFLKALLGLGV